MTNTCEGQVAGVAAWRKIMSENAAGASPPKENRAVGDGAVHGNVQDARKSENPSRSALDSQRAIADLEKDFAAFVRKMSP